MISNNQFETVYWWTTLLTFLGACVTLLYLCFIDMMIGFDSEPYDWLMALTLLATVGLFTGSLNSLSTRLDWPKLNLACSLYFVSAFAVITVEGFGPPLGWWIVAALASAEVVMSSLRLRQIHQLNDSRTG
jgi:hypothetical protein